MNPDYTEMDLPLTERTGYPGATAPGHAIHTGFEGPIDDETSKQDFDIRKYY